MNWKVALFLVVMAFGLTTFADKKDTGTTALKDVQPVGTTDKNHKKQQYDLLFISAGKEYTCRTSPKSSIKATDFVVGSDVRYEVKGDKAKVKSSTGKQLDCMIVRVSNASPTN